MKPFELALWLELVYYCGNGEWGGELVWGNLKIRRK